MGWTDWFNPFSGSIPGVPDIMADPLGTPLADGLGLNSPLDYASKPWAIGDMISSDWRTIKHWIIPDMRRDREVMTNGAVTSRRLIYGTAKVSGQIVYEQTTGAGSEVLHLAIVFAGHPCDSVIETYLDDYPLSIYGEYAYVATHLGDQVAADPLMVTRCAPFWTVEHKLLGVSYAYVELLYSDMKYPNALPIPKFVVKGMKVYDPRTGLTVWSDNPALCILHYMLLSEDQGGMGCNISEIDIASFITAANICEELVVCNRGGTSYESRYTMNGTINIDSTPASVLKRMLLAMDGSAVYSQGVWKIYAGKHTAAVATLDESWLAGGITFSLGADKNDRVNTVKGTFVDPYDRWAQKDFPVVTSGTYMTADGGEELTLDLPLEFTASFSMAQRIGKRAMEKSRRGLTVDYPCNFKAFGLNVNDTVKVNNTILGWNEKEFTVLDWALSAGGIALKLGEADSNIDNWVPGDVVDLVNPPDTDLPSPWSVAAPINLMLREELYATNIANIIKTRVILSWELLSTDNARIDVQVFPPGGAWTGMGPAVGSATSAIYWDAENGYTQFRIRTISRIGAPSLWLYSSIVVVGKAAPPPPVTSFFVDRQPDGTRQLAWVQNNRPLDMAGWRIRYKLGAGQVWTNMLPLHTELLRSSPYETNQLAAGTYTFAICSEDTTGNISTPVYCEVTLADPRLAGVLDSAYVRLLGWPGTKTDCWVDGAGVLIATDQKDWASFAIDGTDWSEWLTWARDPHLTIVYEHPAIDLGSIAIFTPLITVENTGTATVTMSTSVDGSTWTGWVTPALVTARHIKAKVSVTVDAGNLAQISQLNILLDGNPLYETLNDIDTSTLTGSYRIGVGDIRVPLTKSFAVIKAVSLAMQNVGPGWNWELIDKQVTYGPRIKIYNGSGVLADAVVDFDIKGQ